MKKFQLKEDNLQEIEHILDQKPVTSNEDIEIPLKREEVEVTKTPYVKEEVVIKKKPITETKEVTEDVTSERVNTANTGY